MNTQKKIWVSPFHFGEMAIFEKKFQNFKSQNGDVLDFFFGQFLWIHYPKLKDLSDGIEKPLFEQPV